ncbi:MAG: outer membrane beta-barrel family protein [Bacteroidales bacterium]|nr:outer membrane beta-barrel family protein [Bacteroidales bacterium]
MKKQILLCLLSCIANSVFSQMSIVGKVAQSDNSPVDYFTVRFLSDTTSIMSGSFVGGMFSAAVPSSVNKVEVSAWGFDTERKIISTRGDTLQFTLINQQHELGEVNVFARKNNLTVDGSTYTLSVEGSSMAELANINDVLSRVPLLMVNEKNEVSMFGKDNVVVYVNNRRIVNKKELENLNPQTIKDVKLISSPGARYDANADAVISITTKDYSGTEVAVRNIATKGRLFSNATNTMLNLHHGATNIHADYTFTASKNRSSECSNIHNTEGRQEYNDDEKTRDELRGHTYSIVGEHTFSNEHKLSAQFAGWNERSRPEIEGGQECHNSENLTSVATRKRVTENEDHYDIGAGYDIKLGSQSGITVSANYTTHRVEASSNIAENLLIHDYDFVSKYNATDAQVDYQTTTDNGFNIGFGGKLSAVANESESEFSSSNTALETTFSYEYDFTERIIGAYLELGKVIVNIDTNAGLRVESTNFDGNHNKSNVIDTTYITFAPNLKFSCTTGEKSKLSLTYRTTISRPSFNSLSPNIRYDNTFYYRKGNPTLLPTITSNITLTWNMGSSFWMNIGYRHKRNATIYQYKESENGNAIEVTLSNHSHIYFILASAGYNFRKGRFRSTNSISITKPFAKIKLYKGGYKIDRCAYYFKTINDFAINKHFGVNADFIFNDLGETLLEKKDAMYNLSVGATAYFFNRSLALSLAANDILDSYTFKDHREFGSYVVDHRYDPDNTYVRLTVRYQLLSGKTKRIKAVDSNSQTVDRM